MPTNSMQTNSRLGTFAFDVFFRKNPMKLSKQLRLLLFSHVNWFFRIPAGTLGNGRMQGRQVTLQGSILPATPERKTRWLRGADTCAIGRRSRRPADRSSGDDAILLFWTERVTRAATAEQTRLVCLRSRERETGLSFLWAQQRYFPF
jgi:hypothetical protein